MKSILLCSLALISLSVAKAPVKNEDAADVIPDSYLVVYKSGVSDVERSNHENEADNEAKKGKKGIGHKYNIGGFKGYQIEVSPAGLDSIRNSPLVEYVEKDATVTTNGVAAPNKRWVDRLWPRALVTQTGATWGLGRISHRNRGSTSYIYDNTAGANTRVYIIDTGVLTTHTQFGGRAFWGANFVPGAPNTDDNGHGTHVAGTVGGSTYGVAKSTRIIAVKVLNSAGSGSYAQIMSGIQWAVNDATAAGAKLRSVINMSLGGPASAALNSVVAAAVSAGVTTVVAAGNGNSVGVGIDASLVSPASAPSAITVAAIDSTDAKPIWSNYGPIVDIFAPGVSVVSAWNTGASAINTLSGTSMATPHVAGLAAYLIAKEGLASPAAVANRIVALATINKVTNVLTSPNRIAYNGNGA